MGEAAQGIPIDQVRHFEQVLGDVGADAAIYVYTGAGHAFANPSGRNYGAVAAEASWQPTVEFLNRTLQQWPILSDGDGKHEPTSAPVD